ncbi:zinc ribbon domain-containing protein [Methanobrevibacter sp. V74]|uniref:zinc ribbon domain-containing protein n=1 Tax=Methanobrevibacter sp. V74 TaxID=3064279 RepID=UPI002732C009|nr:zinc ribbon domain-containing protein [Methanobrevibacter sp. V74]
MELKDFFNYSNETYEQNMDLLEDYDLINPLGSPNKQFLKFLKAKHLDIKKDKIIPELIEEFESSMDSVNIRLAKKQKEKEIIFKQRKVWINIPADDEPLGSDLILESDGIIIDETGQKILYVDMLDIEIAPGGWSKKTFIISASEGRAIFEVNESKAIPLKEIIEDNISNQNHDEFDDLLDLYSLFEAGEISKKEFDIRKDIICSDDRYCTDCGKKLDSSSLFCPNCGHQVSD